MNLPEPIFVGFFPKRTQPAPTEFNSGTIREIANVAECISPGPEGWIQHWKHNPGGFFDTQELATQVIENNPEEYDLYAYKVFPLRCKDGEIEAISIAKAPEWIPKDYHFLGYDIVTKSQADFFECSPLSCNYLANDYKVNQFCLIDELEA
ncbi:MAG: hypothetical protein P8074_14010, partial [Anaerolineales bacterium]